MPVTRTATFKRSCIPASVDLWNNLDHTTRQKPTLSSFSYALRSQVISNIVPIYYIQGNREMSILHARLRNHCSNLNLDFYNTTFEIIHYVIVLEMSKVLSISFLNVHVLWPKELFYLIVLDSSIL